MADAPPNAKDPAAPALPDASRLPHAPYHPVLTGQPAIVTGANSGIGEAVALGLAQAGADVAINYVTHPEVADEVAHKIEAMGRKAMTVKADVSKEDEVEAMYAAVIARFGTLHISVSNAGLQKDCAFPDMTLQDWETVIGINLTGQFLCTRAAAREFKKRGVVASVSKAAGKLICMGRARQLRIVQGRHPDDDAEHRAGIGAAFHPGEQHRTGRDPHADQYRGLEHRKGLCRPDDAGAL
jgi:glucose 1-dehydrogenase